MEGNLLNFAGDDNDKILSLPSILSSSALNSIFYHSSFTQIAIDSIIG